MYLRLALTSLALGFLGGCRSSVQTVEISSSPPGASIQIDGYTVGQAPLQIELKTNQSHTVTADEVGYKTQAVLLVARKRGDAPYVQFGLKADAGHYQQLTPDPLHLDLVSDIVPESVGAERFDELGERIAQLDALLEAGKITAAEHARIMEQILAVYE